ncbi:MAG: tripartite tricarboxylate transporter substrate binding protein [Xanthobacteraceae bacterium]
MAKLSRRAFCNLAASSLITGFASPLVAAGQYPTRPVRLIVGFPPGGAADLAARLIGQRLSARLGQAVVVENQPGASGNIGTEAVVRAPPDGYSLLFVTSTNAINAGLYGKLNFNFVSDIAPVAGVSRNPFILVLNPSVPAKTVPDFIAYAKANPGKIAMGSAGNGTPHHLFGELFMMMTGVDMLHVPYRGEGPALADLMGGQIQVMFTTGGPSLGYVRSGKLRVLAVTSATRLATLPGVPSLNELVPGYEAVGWFGIGAPKTTPAEIVTTLNSEVVAALNDANVKARFAQLGLLEYPSTAAEFGKYIASETEKWAKVIRTAKITAS